MLHYNLINAKYKTKNMNINLAKTFISFLFFFSSLIDTCKTSAHTHNFPLPLFFNYIYRKNSNWSTAQHVGSFSIIPDQSYLSLHAHDFLKNF